eukprot:1400360-Pleurochrysis_carterae.AAC.1
MSASLRSPNAKPSLQAVRSTRRMLLALQTTAIDANHQNTAGASTPTRMQAASLTISLFMAIASTTLRN